MSPNENLTVGQVAERHLDGLIKSIARIREEDRKALHDGRNVVVNHANNLVTKARRSMQAEIDDLRLKWKQAQDDGAKLRTERDSLAAEKQTLHDQLGQALQAVAEREQAIERLISARPKKVEVVLQKPMPVNASRISRLGGVAKKWEDGHSDPAEIDDQVRRARQAAEETTSTLRSGEHNLRTNPAILKTLGQLNETVLDCLAAAESARRADKLGELTAWANLACDRRDEAKKLLEEELTNARNARPRD